MFKCVFVTVAALVMASQQVPTKGPDAPTDKPNPGATGPTGETNETTAHVPIPTTSHLCADSSHNCQNWEKNGFCTDPFYVDQWEKYCAKTCGYCKPPNNDCHDMSTECYSWNQNGFCHNKAYTDADKKKYCAKTCGYC